MNVVRFIPDIFRTKSLIAQILIATSLAVTGNYYAEAKPNATKSNKSNKAQHNANTLDNLKINGKNHKWSEIKDVDLPVEPLFKMGERMIDPSMVGPHGGRMKSKFVPIQSQSYSIPVEVVFWLLATPFILLIVRKIIF